MAACQKSEERSCFKTTGEESELVVSIDEMSDSILLFDNLIYTIVPSEERKIVLQGGRNLLPHIGLEVNEGKWTIQNNNKCNFIRSFKHKISATIYLPKLSYIYYEGSASLTINDTLHADNLEVRIRDGAGSVNLMLQANRVDCVVTYGFADFSLAGKVNLANLTCQTNSTCDTRNLEVNDRLTVSSLTQGNMLVNADQAKLTARIFRDGNIFYTGVPSELNVQKEGQGVVEHLP